MDQAVSPGVAVGIDLVQISRIDASLSQFGQRFQRRLFTAHEIAYCTQESQTAAERFAARFAAKEAVIKLLRPEDGGLGWRAIEVRRAAAGFCELALHDAAKERAVAAGLLAFSLSMSHEGDYATAVVVATRAGRPSAEGTRPQPAAPTPASTAFQRPGQDFWQGEPVVMIEQVRTIIREHGRLTSSFDALSDESDLYRAGMTSQASVNVMLALESEFDIEFPDSMLKRSVFASVAAISRAVAELLGSRAEQYCGTQLSEAAP